MLRFSPTSFGKSKTIIPLNMQETVTETPRQKITMILILLIFLLTLLFMEGSITYSPNCYTCKPSIKFFPTFINPCVPHAPFLFFIFFTETLTKLWVAKPPNIYQHLERPFLFSRFVLRNLFKAWNKGTRMT